MLAAATLPTATRDRESGSPGDGDGDGGGFLPPPPEESPAGAADPPSIPSELFVLIAVIVVLALVWHLYHNRRAVLFWAAQVVVLAGVGFVLYWLLSERLSSELGGEGQPEPEAGFGEGGGNGADPVIETDPSLVSVLLVLLAGLFLVGLVVAMTRTGAGDDEDERQVATSEETAAAIGRAAGRAADRLAEAERADNEIYRAWIELTELVSPPNSETKTPGEFAALAVDAGMEPTDVRELTGLFEEVRYGTYEPSEADERRAIGLFRRIESTYAEETA